MRSSFLLFISSFLLIYSAVNFYIGLRTWQSLAVALPLSGFAFWLTWWALAAIPQLIRGYGPVRERHLIQARRREAELRARLEAPVTAPPEHAPPEHA